MTMVGRNVNFVTVVIMVTLVTVIFDTGLTSSVPDSGNGLTSNGRPTGMNNGLQHFQNTNHMVINNADLVSSSSFIITVRASQATTISTHHLAYTSSSIPPEHIIYAVTKPLGPGQGHLLLIDQPNKQVQRFTQADVNAQKLVYIPPRAEAVPIEQLLVIELDVIRASDNSILVHQPFRIRLQPLQQQEPQFKIVNPTINGEKGKPISIMKSYFEIDGTDNENPDLKFVITEMPKSGTLNLLCANKPSVDLDGGIEFSLHEFRNCVVQYQYKGDIDQVQDMFEILATDGQFELANHIYLNIIPHKEESTTLSERKGGVVKKIEYMLQFGTNQHVITIQENCSSVRVPVQRWGDLSTEAQVLCYTVQRTAIAGEDFVERPRNSEKSLLIFAPGITMIDCEVKIIDDKVHESEETLELRLENLYGTAQAILGENAAITMKIVDFEDRPKVQFDRDEISVSEPMTVRSGDATSTITVNVVRSGDISKEARVRVSTCDHSASAGVDYEPLSQLLVFNPNTETLPVRIRVIHRITRVHTQTFSLVLSPKELAGVELGEISSITIKVNRCVSGDAMKVLPSQPIVVSLLEYETRKTGTQDSSPSPGYPLVCVSSCNNKHPHYSATEHLCQDSGIDESNIAYSWEIAVPSLNRRTHSSFRPIIDSTIYGNARVKVLDPLFFARKFRVRCVTTPFAKSENGQKINGIALKSKPVTIGSEQKSICPMSSDGNTGDYHFREHSFVAVLRYIDTSSVQDSKHKNTINIHLEVPHSDGMVSLISTLPLTNPRLILHDRRHTAQHLCSNLHNNSAFLVEFSKPSIQDAGFSRPHQLSDILRGNDTVNLYQHLNLNTCTWTFDAWLHMSQLVDNCGGKITSEFQVGDHSESYVTVQVPLYVTYMSASAPRDWMAVEHRTELEVSFYYTSLLWQGGFNTKPQFEAVVQIMRVATDEEGRLIVDFGTVAQFRGYFVISHHSLPGLASEVLVPSTVKTNFTLDLVWSQSTWDGPEQMWRATSLYSLQDYSGDYTLKLIPCTAHGSKQYLTKKITNRQRSADCTPHTPVQFSLPVLFRQSSRPTPLVYNLNTHFTVTNNPTTFLTRPTESTMDYVGVFSPGEVVYGRVLWQASQHLHSAYSLTIQRLYLCAGVDGYVPLFDPSGQQNSGGPQYGCLQTSPKIKHSFLLLDRENPYSVDKYFNDVSFEVHFASDFPEYEQLERYPGLDGFIFKVDPLYKINSGYTWYLQVLYTIGAASLGRYKRSASDNSAFLSKPQNGTEMKSLHLKKTEFLDISPENDGEEKQNVMMVRTLLVSALVVITGIVSLWAKMKWNTGKENMSGYSTNRRNQVPLNSELHRNIKMVKVRSVPAVTVWNDIRGHTTEV